QRAGPCDHRWRRSGPPERPQRGECRPVPATHQDRPDVGMAGPGIAGTPGTTGRRPEAKAMSLPPYEARGFARLLAGETLDGELAAMSEPWRSLAAELNELTADERNACFQWAILLRPDRDLLIKAVADQDPTGPPLAPEENIPKRCATLADVRRLITDTTWPWPGWLAAGVLNAL